MRINKKNTSNSVEIGKIVFAHFETAISSYIHNWNSIKTNRKNQILAGMLGVDENGVDKWRRDGVPVRNPKNLTGAIDRFVSAMLLNSIQPIYEFKKVFPKIRFKRHQLFTDAKHTHNIEKDLQKKTGVYIFYSSTGNIFYIGKSTTNLAVEIHQRINQELTNSSSDVYLTDLKTAQTLKIKKGDALSYISVYETHPAIVNNVEAFLIRVTMNENLNKKKERFSDSLPSKRSKNN
jgi:hypothetical protein